MNRTWSTCVLVSLVIILSISLPSNNAAPAISSQTEIYTTSEPHGSAEEPENAVDEEVLELEHLKHSPPPSHQPSSGGANTKEEILPQLEKQLEEEAQASASIISSDEDGGDDDEDDDNDNENDDEDNDTGGGGGGEQHVAAAAAAAGGGDDADNDNNANGGGGDDDEDEDDGNSDYDEKLEKASERMLMKMLVEYHHKQQQEQQQEDQHAHNHLQGAVGNGKQIDSSADENMKLMKLLPGAARLTFGQHYGTDALTTPTVPKTTTATPASQPEQVPNSEPGSTTIITNNGQRRGDTAEVLLRHSGGQFSAFDMSQYVFWTGDEAGVARAVEELIQKGLMTRENAIQFLRDIRLGIDYLQNTYSSHPMKADRHLTSKSGSDASSTVSATTETHTTIATQTEAAMTNSVVGEQPTLAPEIVKVIERLPSLLKLNELSEQTESTQDYDDVVGRLRLADFLYAEYSLEEVIYQLAKVMFTQSLTRGSEPAQNALQKLTEFLESEGAHGRISPVLQKKILDVLLAALADTLAENPELMKAARSALGKHMERIPQQYTHKNH